MSDTPIMDAVVRPYIGNMDAACVAERDALLDKGRELERILIDLKERFAEQELAIGRRMLQYFEVEDERNKWKACAQELVRTLEPVDGSGDAAVAAFEKLTKATSACSPQPESPSPRAVR